MISRIALPLAFGLAATIAACAGPASSTLPAAGPAPSTLPASGSPSSGSCTAHAVAGDSANGTTVCVLKGSDLTVLLHAPTGDGWSTPAATGGALGTARGVPTPAGYVGWSFPASAAGSAEIRTARPACPSAPPGTMRCQSMVAYVLHVKVE